MVSETFWIFTKVGREIGRHHTKTDVVVEVVDVVVVADGATGIPLIVDEGTATQHTALIGQPCVQSSERNLIILPPSCASLPGFSRSQPTCG
jgi:hypothetical protein